MRGSEREEKKPEVGDELIPTKSSYKGGGPSERGKRQKSHGVENKWGK